MIPKVCSNRRDGRSSFEDLSNYIADGIEQSNESPSKTSWNDLTQYITAQSVLDALGDEVEKTIAVEIGNLASLKTAAGEMYAVASRNHRQKNPVYHFILSWPEHEKPETQDIFAAARHSLAALGLSEHQYIIAIHANTENIHAHVEVNRIHPKTYKAARLAWAHETLHKAARESELQFGWSHDNGLFNVVELDGRKVIVKSDSREMKQAQSLGAARLETWSGEESLESWCRRVAADDIAQKIGEASVTWASLHEEFARFGLRLVDTGGGLRVVDTSHPEATEPVSVAASKAFRFLKRKELIEKLGSFQRAPEQTKAAESTYKRDPLKRLDRKLARKELRDALHARYEREISQNRELRHAASMELRKLVGNDDERRRQALSSQYRAARASIRAARTMSAVQKQQAYMLARMTMLRAKAQLDEQLAQERDARRAVLPALPSWREWVEAEAAKGDEAAISAVRGIVYQEGRERRQRERLGLPEEDEVRLTSIDSTQTDPYVRKLARLSWKVTSHGRVDYVFDRGEPAFSDEGSKLTFGRREVNDDALRMYLKYGADKWGAGLRLDGGDAVFRERAARLANELGIRFANAEMRGLQEALRREAQKTPKPYTKDVQVLLKHPIPDARRLNILPDQPTGGEYARNLHAAHVAADSRQRRETTSGTGVRDMSDIPVARNTETDPVLLPDHAPNRMDVRKEGRVPTVRRPNTRGKGR